LEEFFSILLSLTAVKASIPPFFQQRDSMPVLRRSPDRPFSRFRWAILPHVVLLSQTCRQVKFRCAHRVFLNLLVTGSLQLQGRLLPLSYCTVFRIPQIAAGLAESNFFSPIRKPIFS